MKRFLLIVAFLPSLLDAQVFYSAEQKIIRETLEGSMFLLSRSYQLKDPETGDLFGREGRDEFGHINAIAVKTIGGFSVASTSMFSPWEQDEAFVKYSDKYIPVLGKVTYREFGDSVWTAMLSFDSLYKSWSTDSMVISVKDTATFNGLGLDFYADSLKRESWIVWVFEDNASRRIQREELGYYIYKKAAFDSISSSGYQVINPPISEKNLLGGIYVTADILPYGIYQLCLVGTLVQIEDEWRLYRTSGADVAVDTEDYMPTKEDLTPIGKQGNKVKTQNLKK